MLTSSLGILEGTAAALLVLVPLLLERHGVVQLPTVGWASVRQLGCAVLVGAVYGTLASQSASRFLETACYRRAALTESVVAWTVALASGLFLGFAAWLQPELSRATLWTYGTGILVLSLLRGIAYAGVGARIRSGRLQYQSVAVFGTRSNVERFLARAKLWQTGYNVTGTLEFDPILDPRSTVGCSAMVEAARRYVAAGVSHLVLVGSLDDIAGLERLANDLKRFAVGVVVVPATDNTTFRFLDVVPLGANNGMSVLRKPMGLADAAAKRLFDLVGASLGLVVLSPFLVILALAIKLDSPGPVFYRQERRGFHGEVFWIWKFRSMRVLESGSIMTQARLDDPRFTRVGRVIRAFSVDELPQLLNVLRGEMSLVGPRPHALVHDDLLGGQIASYAHRQRIKPGITGWAQVNGFRGETSTYSQIEGRTRHDLYYVENWSLFLDCWIIVLTILSRRVHSNAL
ncbi:MAG: exopolysaccharide biosynthesis polyprenyl glycosylphosphotransferase [Chthoniobacterales bacterium]